MAKVIFTTLEDISIKYLYSVDRSHGYPKFDNWFGNAISIERGVHETELIRNLSFAKLYCPLSEHGMIVTKWIPFTIGTFTQSERLVVHPLVAKLILAYEHSGKQPSPAAARLFQALADKTGSHREIKNG